VCDVGGEINRRGINNEINNSEGMKSSQKPKIDDSF
jgi:hypothetical protein